VYLFGLDDKWHREFAEKTRPRRKVQIKRAQSIEPYLEDYAFFTLAPLYVYGGIGHSLPDQFEIEAGERKRIIIDYQRTVIGGLGRWGSIIEGIEQTAWEPFCRFLFSCLFVDSGPRQIVWQIRAQHIEVEGTRPSVLLDEHKLPVHLRVFLPDGNRGRLHVKGGLPAKLWWGPPHPKMVEASSIILQYHGRIDHAD